MFTNRLNSASKCGILARMRGNGADVLGAIEQQSECDTLDVPVAVDAGCAAR
jgi:hypothetical protein